MIHMAETSTSRGGASDMATQASTPCVGDTSPRTCGPGAQQIQLGVQGNTQKRLVAGCRFSEESGLHEKGRVRTQREGSGVLKELKSSGSLKLQKAAVHEALGISTGKAFTTGLGPRKKWARGMMKQIEIWHPGKKKGGRGTRNCSCAQGNDPIMTSLSHPVLSSSVLEVLR